MQRVVTCLKYLHQYCIGLFITLGAMHTIYAAAPPLPDCVDLSDGQKIQLGFDYPYKRPYNNPPYSYLYVRGSVYRYHDFGAGTKDLLREARVLVDGKPVQVKTLLEKSGLTNIEPMQNRTSIIGYGANAAPSALRRKYCQGPKGFTGNAVFPVIKGTLKDFDIVYSPHFVFNGSMPSSIAVSKDTQVQVYITFLDDKEKQYMDETEGVPQTYSVGVLNNIQLQLESHDTLNSASVYVDCHGSLQIQDEIIALGTIPASHRRFAAYDEKGAMLRLFPEIGYNAGVYCFVWENVTNSACKSYRNQQAQPYRKLFNYPHYVPEAGKACPATAPVKSDPAACTQCGRT